MSTVRVGERDFIVLDSNGSVVRRQPRNGGFDANGNSRVGFGSFGLPKDKFGNVKWENGNPYGRNGDKDW